MTIDPRQFSNYLPLTISLFVVLAWGGAIVGTSLVFIPIFAGTFLLGPLALLTAAPLALAQFAAGLMATFVTPVWALLGGWVNATSAANKAATGRIDHGLTLFSETHPIHEHLNKLGRELGLPPVKYVGWFPDERINAFAMGLHQHEAIVGFSAGAIRTLSKEEMNAVMAHELAHIANHDMARMTYAVGVQDSLTWFLGFRSLKAFARWVFTPLSEMELMRMSRSREYWADAIGARLTSPAAMAGALRKIQIEGNKPGVNHRASHFMFQSNAVSAFSTHPPLSKRIAALHEGRFIQRVALGGAQPATTITAE